MEKLNQELAKVIECKIKIEYGQDLDNHDSVMRIKSVCDKYGLKNKLEHIQRYCCDDYVIFSCEDKLSLFDTEKFIEELKLNVSIYYDKGYFHATYDNTYY